jgi:hypothetical protein
MLRRQDVPAVSPDQSNSIDSAGATSLAMASLNSIGFRGAVAKRVGLLDHREALSKTDVRRAVPGSTLIGAAIEAKRIWPVMIHSRSLKTLPRATATVRVIMEYWHRKLTAPFN